MPRVAAILLRNCSLLPPVFHTARALLHASSLRGIPPSESDLGKVLAAMKSDKAYEVQHAIESLLAVEKWHVLAIPYLVERLVDEREPDKDVLHPFTIADQAGEALASIGKPAVPALQKVIVKRGNDAARIRAIDAWAK